MCVLWLLSQSCSWSPPTLHILHLLNHTHLIQVIRSLAETPRPEISVLDEGDMENLQCCWGPGTGLGNTALEYWLGVWQERMHELIYEGEKRFILNVNIFWCFPSLSWQHTDIKWFSEFPHAFTCLTHCRLVESSFFLSHICKHTESKRFLLSCLFL